MTLERTPPEPKNIDCAGDIISYSCSILSNSENLHLTWSVTTPGSMPMNIVYDATSYLDTVEYLSFPWKISTVLTKYQIDTCIESTIYFMSNASLDGTFLECGITDLGSTSDLVRFNSLGIVIAIISTLSNVILIYTGFSRPGFISGEEGAPFNTIFFLLEFPFEGV